MARREELLGAAGWNGEARHPDADEFVVALSARCSPRYGKLVSDYLLAIDRDAGHEAGNPE